MPPSPRPFEVGDRIRYGERSYAPAKKGWQRVYPGSVTECYWNDEDSDTGWWVRAQLDEGRKAYGPASEFEKIEDVIEGLASFDKPEKPLRWKPPEGRTGP